MEKLKPCYRFATYHFVNTESKRQQLLAQGHENQLEFDVGAHQGQKVEPIKTLVAKQSS